MVSGPLALTLIGAPGLNIERPQLPKWRVFVQSTYAGSRFIKADSNILYQVIHGIDIMFNFLHKNNMLVVEFRINCKYNFMSLIYCDLVSMQVEVIEKSEPT